RVTPAPATSRPVRLVRMRWLWQAATPLATLLLPGAFLFQVTPRFKGTTTLRLVEDEAALGGALTGAAQGATGGLSMLASLTGRGVPLQTEMAVLGSRGLAEALAEELGLRLRVVEPSRVLRTAVLSEVALGMDGPEGRLRLRRQADGTFRVTADLLAARDPFRLIRSERRERVEVGSVAPGEPIPLEGTRLVLAPGAGAYERIELRLLSRDKAMEELEKARSVTRPQREADVVEVSVAWPDPDLAAEAANRLAALYLARREELRVEKAGLSARFLRAQVGSVGVELKAAEEALRGFREARDVVAPEAQVTAEVTRLAELKGRRDLLQAERFALAQLVERVAAGGGAGDRELVFFPSLLQSQATSELIRLLGELENQRALRMERRTPDAAEIQLIDARIRAIEGDLRGAAGTYLQGLDDQVVALDAALSGFEAELGRVPAVEMEYVRLRRQVELLTELSAFLEMRRAEAELNAAKEGVGAYVLAAARPAEEPSSPRPALTLALALLVGLVLGAGGAVAAEQAAPSTEE
ncbi:MAG: hypothetical protein Q8N53_17050, partial [Longimicrobiales bacterium]|nr:hypothetical protein [Longimicrobiales bacterium]